MPGGAGLRLPVWLRQERLANGSNHMPWKVRLVLVLTMSSVMVAMVTLLVTYLNLGLPADFAWHWAKAYLIAWPVAAATGYFIMPSARRLTDRIVAHLDGLT
jgi:hypothetical protein